MNKYSYSIKDLQVLIKSLSGTEKRYFSLLSTAFIRSSKEPIYMKLFQSLLEADSELSDAKIPADQLVLKKRLLENILRSLRLFHQSKSVEMGIQNALCEIEILYDLNLPKQSYYILHKAYTLARKHERFALLLQLLEWEKRINMLLVKPSRTIDALATEEAYITRQITQLQELENIFSRMKHLKKEYGQVKGEIGRSLQQELARIEARISYEECISEKAKFYYNYTYTLFCWITFDHSNAYLYSKRLLDTAIQHILPNEYIEGILEHATSCIQIGQFREALSVLDLARKAARSSNAETIPMLSTKLFFYTLGYQLVIYNYMGDVEKLQEVIERAEREIVYYERSIPLEAKNVLMANLMNAYLGVNNLKKAEEIWETLFQSAAKSARKSIYDDLRLFRLFKLIQDSIYEVVPSAALSAYRYYSKPEHNPTQFEVELKVSAVLQKNHNLDDPAVRNMVMETVRQLFAGYIVSLGNDLDFQEQYSLYVIWADSIINKQPFHETARTWYLQFEQRLAKTIK